MKDVITVPRATWDAICAALEGIMRWQVKNVNVWHNSAYDIAHDALTAANAVSEQQAIVSRDADADHGVKLSVYGDHIHPNAAGRAVVAKAFAAEASKQTQKVVMLGDSLTMGVFTQCSETEAEQAQEQKVKLIPTAEEMGTPTQPQAITPETGNAATPLASAITAGNGQQAQEPVEADGYGSTDLPYDFIGWNLAEGDKRLVSLVVTAFGNAHPAYDDLEQLLLLRAMQRKPAPKQAEPAWQPIESAPSGVQVLVTAEFDGPNDWRIKVGDKDAHGHWIVYGASWRPTHWMPLPTPPEAA